MMNIEKLVKNRRTTLALTGVTPEEFTSLFSVFSQCLLDKRDKDYLRDDNRKRKPGGGAKGVLPTPAQKLFFILCYYKCYPTYDLASFLFNCDRSNACRRQQYLSPILETTLKRKLVLPKRQMRTIEEFFKAFPEAKEIFVDGTERPVRGKKEWKNQQENYSGKTKRQAKRNILIVDNAKRIGFLGKTTGARTHDFTLLKVQASPDHIPKDILIHVDRGFQGIDTQFPEHRISLPQRKPRVKELTEHIKEQNRAKSNRRILVEHAIGGVKRLGIVSNTFRSRLKNMDDQVMLIACGLWNYHLAQSC